MVCRDDWLESRKICEMFVVVGSSQRKGWGKLKGYV